MAFTRFAFLLLLLSLCADSRMHVHEGKLGDKMDCDGAYMCGVLTLEGGEGTGKYHHPNPSVHGLWPQVPPYGNSKCVAPSITSLPPFIRAKCYDDLGFQTHEWKKHGVCAGVRDCYDFAHQVCELSAAPVAIMKKVGEDFSDQVDAVRDADYPVFAVDQHEKQIEIAVCAGVDGRWKIVPPEKFGDECSPNVIRRS